MACNHKFQGHKDGVRCLLCGLRMTPEEYAEYLHPRDKPEKTPDKQLRKRKKVQDDAEP